MIDDYLAELRRRLRGAERDRILAEAEDHLRESIGAGLSAGLTRVEAEEAAISAYGSVTAVVRAHRRRRDRLADAVFALWKLGAVTLTAVGASGLVAGYLNHTLGRSFVGQAPAGTRFDAAHCQYWQSIWHASTCAHAAMLESSSDAVSLRLLGGFAGLLALGGYVVVRRFGPRALRHAASYPRRASERRLFLMLAAGLFGLATVALIVVAQRPSIVPLIIPAGPGAYLSGAVVSGALAVGYGTVAARRPARRAVMTHKCP